MDKASNKILWTITYWILLIGWILGAALHMWRVHGGFLTNYLADITFPAWYYIHLRSLQPDDNKPLLSMQRWFGQSRNHAIISIFIVGVITEVSTIYWPNGLFSGVFDPLDIVAYLAGMLACYFFDKERSIKLLQPKFLN